VKDNGVGGASSTHGIHEKFMQNFSRKTFKEKTTWKI